MKFFKDIVYNPETGVDGTGDLYLPDTVHENTPLVLSIHGGGWNSMDKARFGGICAFLAEQGCAVFNCNYRLTGTAPWPACGDDCLHAARFLLAGNLPQLKGIRREKIGVIGGSAGGHLALMTGLRFPETSWIVCISGIGDPMPFFRNAEAADYFFGHRGTPEDFEKAFPAAYLNRETCPPVLWTHMFEDQVVPIESMYHFTAAAEKKGISIRTYNYHQRPGLTGHGIWRSEDAVPRLLPELEKEISDFIAGVNFKSH